MSSFCFDFRCASGYIMASDYVLTSVKLNKGLMLRYDDAQRGSKLQNQEHVEGCINMGLWWKHS